MTIYPPYSPPHPPTHLRLATTTTVVHVHAFFLFLLRSTPSLPQHHHAPNPTVAVSLLSIMSLSVTNKLQPLPSWWPLLPPLCRLPFPSGPTQVGSPPGSRSRQSCQCPETGWLFPLDPSPAGAEPALSSVTQGEFPFPTEGPQAPSPPRPWAKVTFLGLIGIACLRQVFNKYLNRINGGISKA